MFAILAGIYVNKLLDVAFFPFWIDGSRYFRSAADYVDVSLDFSILSDWQCVGNVIMTVPIGILLAFVADWSNRRCVTGRTAHTV